MHDHAERIADQDEVAVAVDDAGGVGVIGGQRDDLLAALARGDVDGRDAALLFLLFLHGHLSAQASGLTPITQRCRRRRIAAQRTTPTPDGDQVVACRAGDPHGALRPVAPAARGEIDDRPDQEGAEEEKVGERAVGEEMREGPDLHREDHRVAEPRLHSTRRHDEGGEQDEGHEVQRDRKMLRPDRRRPEHHRIEPGKAVAPDDKDEPDDRDQRVEALPGAFPNARDQALAPVLRENADGMVGEEDHEAGDQDEHGSVPAQWRRRMG